MRLVTRYFAATSLLVVATILALVLAADRVLRTRLERGLADELTHQAHLIATLLPADSTRWPEVARDLGHRIGRRVTLIAPDGTVRGDTEFGRPALPRLENHGRRPEVVAARSTGRGEGRDRRVSASTNEAQIYVAVAGGPPGLAVVRVSATVADVDAEVHAAQRLILLAGLVALVAAAVVAWLLARALTRPLVGLAGAAEAIAAGRAPAFPDSRVPEIAQHAMALRLAHDQLSERFGALKREREESEALLAALSDGVLAAGSRGDILAANPAARRLLGYPAEGTLPLLSELFHDKAARDLIGDVMEGREVADRELDVGGRTLLVTGRSLPDGRALLVLRDVTRLRRLESVRRDFVANVSHELKTPLTAIAGWAETLTHEVQGDEARRFAETILTNARRMQHLVDELLDLSRIEAGAWRPAPKTLALHSEATEAWAEFAEQARARGVTFDPAVAPDTKIAADPDALRQIFSNLFDNALRHTPSGGHIRVTAKPSRGGVELTVEDTGAGIPQEHLPRIFERFYRVDAARSRAEGGTGLGLAIVKHLVEAHGPGARVSAESALGQGTTIRMVFPGRHT